LGNNQLSEKVLPFDKQNYSVVEYSDFFLNGNSKKVRVKDLGEKFAAINSFFFDYLKEYHIPIAFIKLNNKVTLKFIKHERFLFYIKILNLIDKRTSKVFKKKEGELLDLPIFELHFGDQKDTLVNDSHLITFNLCTNEDMKIIYRICSKVNAVLKSFFERRNELLAEVSCFFGKAERKIYLIDDFTPKGMKIIPVNKGNKWIDPYKLSTSAEIKKYTDALFNMTSA
jgi:phosphoribosylaminoimidazole-succinocarboxamide synthase